MNNKNTHFGVVIESDNEESDDKIYPLYRKEGDSDYRKYSEGDDEEGMSVLYNEEDSSIEGGMELLLDSQNSCSYDEESDFLPEYGSFNAALDEGMLVEHFDD